MLDPRWRKVVRDLRVHGARTVVVIVAIAAGIAGAGAVLDAWALVEVATREGFLASNPASATLRVDSVDQRLLERVRAVPEVETATAMGTVVGRVRVGAGWRVAMLFVRESFEDNPIGRIEPEGGTWPPGDDGLVIERSSLELAGAALGETVEVAGLGDPVPLAVTGVARDVGLAPGWMEHLVYGFITPATAARLGAPRSLDQLQLVVRDRSLDQEGVRRIAFEVKAVVEAAGRRVADVAVPVPGEHVHAAQMDSLLFTQGAFGVLALLLSAVLVVNLISAMLAGQVREIGVMKVFGAGSGQLAAMYLVFALAIGAAATGIGVPVALLGGGEYARLKAELLNFEIEGVGVPGSIVALQVLIGLLVPVAAAAIPVGRGCRIPVGAALRDLGFAFKGGSTLRFDGLAGLGRPVLLSLRNAFRRRQRLALTVAALAAGGAVFLGARNLRGAIRASIDVIFAPHQYQVAFRLDRPAPADSIEGIARRVVGIARAEAWAAARAFRRFPDGTLGNGFPITAPPVGSVLLDYPVVDGRWLRSGDGRVLVAGRGLMAEHPDLTIGAEIELTIAGATDRWTVVGIAETPPGASAFAPREAVASTIGAGDVDRLMIAFDRDGAGDELAVIGGIRSAFGAAGLPIASSQLVAESRRVTEDHLLMVADFLGAMGWLMLAVGGLAIGSTMGMSVVERTREIGILKAIGARHGAILALVEVEALVIALLSWVVALPLSVPISLALGRVFGRIMLPVPDRFGPEPAGVGWWLLLSVGVAIVAAAVPAIRAARTAAAVSLRYE